MVRLLRAAGSGGGPRVVALTACLLVAPWFAGGAVVVGGTPIGSTTVSNSSSRPLDFYPQDWLRVASGGQTTCGISTDHRGWCWGDSEQGQVGLGQSGHTASISAPDVALDNGKTLWTGMAVGGEHSCGVHADGSLWCWGDDSHGQLGDGRSTLQTRPVAVKGGVARWSEVSAGTSHTCGVGSDGSLWCWGANPDGQLGIGSTRSSNVPARVSGSGWSTVSAGGNHTCATHMDQSLWCWGDNSDGELGVGSTANHTSPVRVGTLTWAQVSSGRSHTCGLSAGASKGLVWCWGDTGVATSTTPHRISTIRSWVFVSAGDHETCGTQSNGQIYCWGTNAFGQLGQGDTQPRRPPAEITFRLGWKNAVAGGLSTCGIRSNSTLWCWGYNSYGQVGDHAREPRYLPTPVNLSTKWLDVGDSGGNHTCAVSDAIATRNGLFCWGVNDHGQLGDATTMNRSLPKHIGQATWLSVTGGEAYSCGIRVTKSLWCWGANEHGQLGIDNETESHAPKQVAPGFTTIWAQVSAGNDHTCAVGTGGGLWCWGNNAHGELGVGSTRDTNAPVRVLPPGGWVSVSAGISHTCAIRGDRSLWCWGDNRHGELGDGSKTQRLKPVEVANDPRDWKQVDVGGSTSCAIDDQHRLFCWGIDDHGQAGLGGGSDVTNPTGVGQVTWYYVSVAADHSCGSTAPAVSPHLLCWGVARDGDLGDGNASGEEDRPSRMHYQLGDPWYQVFTYDDRTCGEKAFTECFGDDSVGQLGDGSPAPYWPMPTTIFIIPT